MSIEVMGSLGSWISAMYGASPVESLVGASTNLSCVSSGHHRMSGLDRIIVHKWPRRGGFAVGLNLTCESTRRRECSAKSVAKMIFSWGATTTDVLLGDSKG